MTLGLARARVKMREGRGGCEEEEERERRGGERGGGGGGGEKSPCFPHLFMPIAHD